MIKTITNAFMAIIHAFIKMITGILNGILWVFKSIFNGFMFLINAVVSMFVAVFNAFVSVGKKVVNSFKPVYRVTFTMYHVIPGVPVQENETVHTFERGATKEAIAFYNKVVNMTIENKIAPTEVKLKKGKKVVQSKQFGPIADIKKFKIAA